MASTTDGCYGKYESSHPLLPGLGCIDVEKFVEEIINNTIRKYQNEPEKNSYAQALLKNKDYILNEIEYVKNQIKENRIKDFTKQIKEHDKMLYELIKSPRKFRRKNLTRKLKL